MEVTVVHVHVKEECIPQFIDATEANHKASTQEPGNRRFDILQDPNNKAHFILYEAYASRGDAVAHKETPHYLSWREVVAPMMAKPREGIPFKGLFPKSSETR